LLPVQHFSVAQVTGPSVALHEAGTAEDDVVGDGDEELDPFVADDVVADDVVADDVVPGDAVAVVDDVDDCNGGDDVSDLNADDCDGSTTDDGTDDDVNTVLDPATDTMGDDTVAAAPAPVIVAELGGFAVLDNVEA